MEVPSNCTYIFRSFHFLNEVRSEVRVVSPTRQSPTRDIGSQFPLKGRKKIGHFYYLLSKATMTISGSRRTRLKSNQFEYPRPKGEAENPRRGTGCLEREHQCCLASRRTPRMAVSEDNYSLEMSMKTVEMRALIKGTSPEAVFIQEMAHQYNNLEDSEDSQAQEVGNLCIHNGQSDLEDYSEENSESSEDREEEIFDLEL